SCLLGVWISEATGSGSDLDETVYWVALLRYIGCTGHAHEVAQVIPDEISIRARSLLHDSANPDEVVHDVLELATAGRTVEERERMTHDILAGLHDWAVNNFTAGCEVADMLAARLGFGPDVREALRFTFERWNGHGWPSGASGQAIPLAMRIVHL